MTKQQLDDALGQIEICELFDDLALDDTKKEEDKKVEEAGQELDGIDDLIARMEKVTIEK